MVGTEILARRCNNVGLGLPSGQYIKSVQLLGESSFRVGERGSGYVDVMFNPKMPGMYYAAVQIEIGGAPLPIIQLCGVQATAVAQTTVGFYPAKQKDFYVNENAGTLTLWVSRDNVSSPDAVSVNLKGFTGTAIKRGRLHLYRSDDSLYSFRNPNGSDYSQSHR